MTATIEALQAMDACRYVLTRDGCRPGRQAIKIKDRSSNRESYLAQCVGEVALEPCKHCKKGSGPYLLCVTVPGYLWESCANCHYNNEGVRCSFRKFFRP